MTETVLIDIQLDDAAARKNIEKTTEAIVKLQNENERLRKEQAILRKSNKQTSESYKANNELIALNTVELNELNRARKQSIKTIGTEATSLDAMRLRLAKLTKERNAQAKGTKEQKKRFDELTVSVKELSDAIKEQEEAGGDFRRSVGNYERGLFDAVPALDAVKTSSEGLLASFKAIIASPIGLTLAALAAAAAAVGTFFTKSVDGSLAFQKSLISLEAVTDVAINKFSAIGRSLLNGFKDFSLEDFIKQFKGLEDEIKNQKNALEELLKATLLYNIEVSRTAKNVAKLSAEEEKNNAIADDATLSFEKRRKAEEEGTQAAIERAKTQLALAKQLEGVIEKELKAKKNADAEELLSLFAKQAEAQAASTEAEAELTRVTFEGAKRRREIRQDQGEQDLDFLIDGFDVQKTINEKKIADDELTFDEKEKLLQKTKDLNQGALTEEVAVLQKFTNRKIDIENLLAIEDARVLNERAKGLALSEKLTQRLLEVIKEQKLATQDFADLEKQIAEQRQKAAEKEAREAKRREEEFKREQARKAKLAEDEIKFNDKLSRSSDQTNQEKLQSDLETLEKRKEALEKYGQDTLKIEREIALKKKEIAEQEVIEENQRLEERKIAAQAFRDFAIDIANQGIELGKQQAQVEFENFDREQKIKEARLKERFKNGEISEEQFNRDIAGLQAERLDEEKKLFEKQKKADIAQALIKTFQAAISAFQSLVGIPVVGPVLAPVGAAAATAFGLKQVDLIRQQKFAKGGKAGTTGGNLHSAGGTKYYGDDGNVVELERGEDWYVLNRSASSDTIGKLSALNTAHGGDSWTGGATTRFAQRGGQIATQNNINQVDEAARATEAVTRLLQETTIAVSVEDINAGQTRVRVAEDRANF